MVESFLVRLMGIGGTHQLMNTNANLTPKHTYLHQYHNVCIHTLTYIYACVVLCLLFSLSIYLYRRVYFAI